MIANFLSLIFCLKSRILGLLFIILFYPTIVFGQSDLVSAINTKLIPLKSVDTLDDFSDLKPLKSILINKNVVGLGEATHGTHEFFTMKHRLVKFLVKEMGFRIFTIEADFAGTFAMNDYVLYGKGTAKDAIEKMGIGVWYTKEFISMIEWIKWYNTTQSSLNKVVFYGCDMQWALNAGPYLIDGTIKYKTPLSNDAVKGIRAIINYRVGQIDKSQSILLDVAEKELNNAVIIEDDSSKLNIYKRYISNVLQTIKYAQTKYFYNQTIIRDEAMAENCKWIFNKENNHKMITWTHNAHIAKDITKNNNLPMGSYLAKYFGLNYYAIGFSFNKGEFRAFNAKLRQFTTCTVPDVTNNKSTEFILKQCNTPNFMLDFQSCSDIDIISSFLNDKLNSRLIGAEYNPNTQEDGKNGSTESLSKMYDAIIFINNTSASEQLYFN